MKQFNSNKNLIIDNKIMKYEDMEFNNNFFCKILMDYKSCDEQDIAETIINLIIDGNKILNKIIYKLSIDILEHLLLDSFIFWSIKRKYQLKINEHYKQILQMINDFLSKNTLIEQTKNNYFYEFFEQCFIFNTNDISQDIKNNIFKISILLTNPLKEEETIYKLYQEQIDLLKIPEERYHIIKCLFQKLLCLYDLKYIINNFNDTKKCDLIKNKKFPLYFFDLEGFNINIKINMNKLNLEFYKIKFKLEQEEFYEDGILFINQNYFFICLPHIDNKIIHHKEIKDQGNETFNKTKNDNINKINDNININDEDDYYIIKHRFPLRNVEVLLDENKGEERDKRKKNYIEDSEKKEEQLILIINNEAKIYLLFENKSNNVNIENLIKDNIKKAVEIEYNSLKMYINELLIY